MKKNYYNKHPDQLHMTIPGEDTSSPDDESTVEDSPIAPPTEPPPAGGEPPSPPQQSTPRKSPRRRSRKSSSLRKVLLYVLIGTGSFGGIVGAIIGWAAEGTRNAVLDMVAAEAVAIYRRFGPVQATETEMSSIATSPEVPKVTGSIGASAESRKSVARRRATKSATKSATNPVIRFFRRIGKAVDELFGYDVEER